MIVKKKSILLMVMFSVLVILIGIEVKTLRAEEIKKSNNSLSEKQSNDSQGNTKSSDLMNTNDWWNAFDMAFDPFDELLKIQNKIDSLLNTKKFSENYFNLNTDIRENEKKYIIEMDLPGMEKDNIKVEVKKNYLLVSGARQKEFKEKQDKYIKKERSERSFSEALQLPYDAKISEINVTYKNGVLLIEIPKIINAKKSDDESIRIEVK